VTFTPSIKGLLTKAMHKSDAQAVFNAVRAIFAKHMPRERAKHATRNYLAPRLAEFAR
jgi:hypothetical protein